MNELRMYNSASQNCKTTQCATSSLKISFLQELASPCYKSEHSCTFFPGKFIFDMQNSKELLRGIIQEVEWKKENSGKTGNWVNRQQKHFCNKSNRRKRESKPGS